MLYAPLCLFAFKLVKDQHTAEDLVQECFIKLWTTRVELNNPSFIKSYLYRVVRNKCLRYLRTQQKHPILSDDLSEHKQPTETAIIDHLIFAETTHDIYSAINTLPPKMRRVFRMFYIERKDYSQIASELHLSVKTIRNQKIRALVLLRQKIGPLLLTLLFLNIA